MPNLVVLRQMAGYEPTYGDPSEKLVPSHPGFQGQSFTIVATDTDRSATYDFLLVIIVIMGPPISYTVLPR